MSDGNYNKLLQNAGAPAGVDIIGDWQTYYGGPGDLWVWGDLGGGTLKLEAAINESAPCVICGAEVKNTSPTSSSVVKFNFNHGTRIRATLSDTLSESSGVFARVN